MGEWTGLRFFRTGLQSAHAPALEPLPASYGGGAVAPYPGWSTPCPIVNGVPACRVDFSAMCYFFGRNIYAALAAKGDARPIGLLESCQVSDNSDPPPISHPQALLGYCVSLPNEEGGWREVGGVLYVLSRRHSARLIYADMRSVYNNPVRDSR